MRTHEAFSAVLAALESGRILHAPHPDFGGVVTIGPYHPAVGPAGWAIIHHGGELGVDVTYDDFESPIAAVRSFIFQVGKRNAGAAAL